MRHSRGEHTHFQEEGVEHRGRRDGRKWDEIVLERGERRKRIVVWMEMLSPG